MLKKINLSQGGEGAERLFHMKELSLCRSTQIILLTAFSINAPFIKQKSQCVYPEYCRGSVENLGIGNNRTQ